MTEMLLKEQSHQLQDSTQSLLSLWNKASVPEVHKQFVLAYLPYLSHIQIQTLVKKECKNVQTGSAFYKKLGQQYQNRKTLLIKLKNLLQGQVSKGNLNNLILSEITCFLNQLRNSNLAILEHFINLHKQYRGSKRIIPEHVRLFFIKFDTDNDFLKQSFLNKFIKFTESFDPFFYYHFLHKNQIKRLLNHPKIEQLFYIQLATAVRLRKAQQKMERIIGIFQHNQHQVLKKRSQSSNPPKQVNLNEDEFLAASEQTKRSRSNFKIRSVAIQKGIQVLKQTHLRQSIIKKVNFRLLTEILPTEQSLEQQGQKCPIKNKKPCFHRSRFTQGLIKLKQKNQSFHQNKKKSIAFKQKLESLQQNQNKCTFNSTLNLFNKPLPPLKSQQSIEQDQQSQLKSTNDSQIKEIKMRASKLNYSQLQDYMKNHKITQDIRKDVQINSFCVSVLKNQSYFSEFLINGQVKAIGMCIYLSNGDYLIRVWEPFQNCNQNVNKLLFTKYLEYLQRILCNKIYYYGKDEQLVYSLKFQKLKHLLYVLNRRTPKKQNDLEFPQFLSFKCTNILFPQKDTTIGVLYSDEIQTFNENNYYIHPEIAAINRHNINSEILMMAKISDQIKDMNALNSLLEDQKLDTFAITSLINIGNISSLRINQNIGFLTSFTAGQGYFKFHGQEIYRKGSSLICQIKAANRNTSVLFGKGFSNMESFIKKGQENNNHTNKQCKFNVKMFSKQLYGRIVHNSLNRCAYGNWEFSLSFKDQLQGRIKHTMQNQQIFGPYQFYLAISIESQIIYGLEVHAQDFLY